MEDTAVGESFEFCDGRKLHSTHPQKTGNSKCQQELLELRR